ncbi:nitrogen regulation protein NR(II) [Pelosinus sp. sgz500959]|uniref:two-component system sensor histidine kinase NtrB n=1 Tax=Pelosinus sp. sgz500959 TaxID=3242472 RepID=UPI003672B6D8
MQQSLITLIKSLKLTEEQLDKCTDEQNKNESQIGIGPIYIFDKEYRVRYVSHSGAKKLGLKSSDIEGRHWSEIGLDVEFIEKLEQQIGEVLSTGKTFECETFQLSKIQGNKYFQYTLSPLFFGIGEDRMVLSHIKDITEYKTSEIILTNQIEQLRQAINKIDLIGEMAAGVAHEIRNPMTVIKGYLQIFSKKISGNMEEQLNIVLSELDRVEQIISNFLSVAKTKVPVPKWQDLNKIIREIAPLIFADAINQGINLNVILADSLPDLLLNSTEIKQLILNLARNGIEAMEQHGTLIIETSQKEDKVYLRISDCGCGISKEWQDKMFTPFLTTKENGTGLGLSVCNGIVRHHNGLITVQSTEGEGTTFTVVFNKIQEKTV